LHEWERKEIHTGFLVGKPSRKRLLRIKLEDDIKTDFRKR